MARGGARPNAGRKKGSLTKKTRKLAEILLVTEANASPLGVMLSTMAELLRLSEKELNEKKKLTLRLQACEIAASAAPYCHPRLTAVAPLRKDEELLSKEKAQMIADKLLNAKRIN